MSEENWLFATLLGPEDDYGFWQEDPRRVQAQNRLLRHASAAFGQRRWFFRRAGIQGKGGLEDALLHRAVCVYVEGEPTDSHGDLLALVSARLPQGWWVQYHEPWRPCFDTGYGGPLGHQAMADLCCALARAITTDEHPPIGGVIHWLSWMLGAPDEPRIACALGLLREWTAWRQGSI